MKYNKVQIYTINDELPVNKRRLISKRRPEVLLFFYNLRELRKAAHTQQALNQYKTEQKMLKTAAASNVCEDVWVY